jgi:hypothetical protein
MNHRIEPHLSRALSLRGRAEGMRVEAEYELWVARGYPLDRSGILGVSLLGSLAEIKAELAKFPGEEAPHA